MNRNSLKFACINFVCFLLCMGSGTVYATGEEKNEAMPSCNITVGWSMWPPYQYLSDKGELKGLQIELLKRVAKQAKCHFDFVQNTFSKNVESVENGDIDMMPDITVTESRRKFGLFSKSYRSEMQILYVNNSMLSSCENKTITEILKSGFRLGLASKNRYGDEIESIRKLPQYQSNIVKLSHNANGIEAIFENRIDGFFEDPAVIAYQMGKKHLKGKVASCRVQVYLGDVSLMFSRKSVDKETVSRIDRAIDVVKKTTFYKKHWQW